MSVLSLKRVIQFVVACIIAVPLLANHPSPRTQPRMVFDEQTGVVVLFGGRTNEDPATGLTHASSETWTWVRGSWQQVFPATTPPGRSSHSMVYDSKRGRIVMFGGRKEATVVRTSFTFHDDTWVYQNGDWTELETANRPPSRHFASMAYDRVRDRVVLFGGYRFQADNRTIEPLYDTWEFDGTNWTEIQKVGPSVDKPLMSYDVARNQLILLGINTTFQTQMYRWDVETSSWKAVTPEKLPTCVHEATLDYQFHNERLVLVGGVCSSQTSPIEETWEWDGTNWTVLTTNQITRITGAAVAYDRKAEQLVRYGGASNFGTLQESYTTVLRRADGVRPAAWLNTGISGVPSPRSLAVFRRDPVRDTIVLFGGLGEFSYGTAVSYNSDQWRYTDGVWYRQNAGAPLGCVTPISAFDTNRNVLVVVCNGAEVAEWNGETWNSIGELDKAPDRRRFAQLAYDGNLKKIVMFGGYDNVNFRDDTWTWDGKEWIELKPKTKPPHRSQMSMWYDPLAKKTIVYSGVGRRNIDERVTRYADMWAFDGTNWALVNVTGETPGIRFGAQTAIDPRNGKVVLFGGLHATIGEKDAVSQFYDNDTWTWDGSASRWTKIATANAPTPRQNGAFEYDAASGKFILFGGFGGNFYLSDTWLFDGENWTPLANAPVTQRRRGSRS
ncbi:MAG TPA: kelch repeat-containing protein [Thermoanaerobaculia bacterium]|jgi:hypothetical protein